MDTPGNTPDASDATDEKALRAAMQAPLTRSPAQGLDGLQAKALDPWRRQVGGEQAVALGATAGWRTHPKAWTLDVLALVATAFLLPMGTTPDPALDELLQPDVLSLISPGEL